MRRIKRAQKVCRCRILLLPSTFTDEALARVQLLRHLQAANEGYLHSITRAYETAYGVRGKIRHAILEVRLVDLPFAVSRADAAPLAVSRSRATEAQFPAASRCRRDFAVRPYVPRAFARRPRQTPSPARTCRPSQRTGTTAWPACFPAHQGHQATILEPADWQDPCAHGGQGCAGTGRGW